MALKIKSFVSVATLINNTPNMLSELGELSTLARTYSKDIWEYSLDAYPGYKSNVFSSVSTTTNIPTPVNTTINELMFSITKSMVELSMSLFQPYNRSQYTAAITSEYFSRLTDITFGDFKSNGVMALPEWVNFKTFTNDDVTFWLADSSFRDMYDGFEIIVIPPVTPIDDMFGPYSSVKTALTARSQFDTLKLVNDAIAGYPQTEITQIEVPFIDSYAPTISTPSLWISVIYGKYGNNPELIKNAIVQYITANSSRPINDWKTILPYLFTRSEFRIVPRWEVLSIVNNTPMSSLYGSILNYNSNLLKIKTIYPSLTDSQISEYLAIMPMDYKAIMLLCLGSGENPIDKKQIQFVFPDYIPVNTLSTDFGRMSYLTREWSTMLKNAVVLAETAIQTTAIHTPYRSVLLDGLLYIGFNHNDINYLVACKSNSVFNVA